MIGNMRENKSCVFKGLFVSAWLLHMDRGECDASTQSFNDVVICLKLLGVEGPRVWVDFAPPQSSAVADPSPN